MNYIKKYLLFVLFLATTASKAQTTTYKNIVKEFPANYVKDGSIDYTNLLQAMINKYDTILMPNFPILINDKGLTIPSNKLIRFQDKSKLVLKPTNKSNYAILVLENVKNVKLHNVTIEGDRYKHMSNLGEWGMGIQIKGGSNISIVNANITKCWGDGIYITKGTNIPSSILISNSIIADNRRNGISVINGDDILIQSSVIKNINDVLPMAAVDIEPNSSSDYIGKIVIDDLSTENCNISIQLGLSKYPSKTKRDVNILVRNVQSYNDNHGILYGDFYRESHYGKQIKPLGGNVMFENITIKNAKKEPIKYYSQNGYAYSP